MLKLGIIGCGWLGSEVLEKALERGIQTVTTSRKENGSISNNYTTVTYQLGQKFPFEVFASCNYILLSLPVNKNNSVEDFSLLIDDLVAFEGTIIFTSSISVYYKEGENNEESEIDSNNPNAQIESLLKQKFKQVIILRLGGLIGKQRHPIHYLAGKEVKNGEQPINLIHLDDIVRILFLLMDNSTTNGLFNIVHPDHPLKKDYYTEVAREKDLTPPLFLKSDIYQSSKIIDGTKITSELKYTYSKSL